VFIMGFTFGLLVWLPLIMGRGQMRNAGVADNFLVVVSLYAFTLLGQVSYWNSFGFDRSAAQAWFVMPVPLARTLFGKNLAAALFIFLEVAAVTAACLLMRIHIAPARLLEAFLVTPVAALYMLSLGNLSSVHFPRPMTPERVSQGGSANRFQGLLFLLYPFALLPILLAYLARWALASSLAFYMVLGFAAVLGIAVYWISMESAVDAGRARRELLLAELARGEGPVVTE
jgi:ABC-2 type transport system permease protein